MKIAMKCNQDQWDSIKDRLVDYNLITNFDKSDYLVNCYQYNKVTNLPYMYASAWADEVYYEWDEQLFLKACGIEPKQSYQYISGMDKDWQDFPDSWKVRVKPDYSKEIAELERQIQELKNK